MSEAAACPQCRSPMQEVTARARTGYLILLDQCPACGGIWCDRWELFPLSADEAARLDPVDEKRLATDTLPHPPTGTCPRCGLALKAFHDPLLPADAAIQRCPLCEGMWLNRGELRRFKQRAARPLRPRPEDIEQLARDYASEAKWATVPDLGSALQERRDLTEDAGELRGQLWSATAWLVLRVLLRVLLRV